MYSVVPILFMISSIVFMLLCILVNVLFLTLEIELPDELKIALPGILTCLIMLAIIQLY
ncbi:TPA: hypothetical protein QCX23_002916 [Bacillus toyonensis]|nr:hypothetical protein [Bacillus toyonensis]HDR7395658.1 hypothetical protein [Bacillus toyonensis]HDR7483564.1 hypothetical protein [Bacillus toyonensis]HDR7844401.1 hypothetical protein [Bacillus toyonensis]